MAQTAIKQIILFHPVKFAAKSYEKFLKQLAQINVYSMDEFQEFTYLIDELKPEIVLVHGDIFQNYDSLIIKEIEKSQVDTNLVVLGNEGQINSIKSTIATILEPIGFEELVDNMKALLAQNPKTH